MKRKFNENHAPIWNTLIKMFRRSKQKRIAINLSKINRYSEKGDTVIVPGKVLGSGMINHPVYIAALSFSEVARTKILSIEGDCLTIPEIIEKNPLGSSIKILG